MNKPLVTVMNGVNMNMLGQRDPKQYGCRTLDEINQGLGLLADELGLAIEFFQSNFEGEFVEKIHAAHQNGTAGLLVNAGAWSHYNYAIADALAILRIPVIEVHMTNVQAREEFRRFSVLSPMAVGIVAGFGENSYHLALRAMAGLIRK